MATLEKQSQKEFVTNELKNFGFISRNKCLRNYISRLSAIIFVLKEEGFNFETQYVENPTNYGAEKDFVYLWSNRDDGDVKTVFYFKWFDNGQEEQTTEITALNFNDACSKFLSQIPIFLDEISEVVKTKIGFVFSLAGRKDFKDFKIKK